ncbi:hypothetical protein MKQ70_17650 [Chitinophaga sedimenti]|uniref:hypothetical protein n=1 Tax=Chitinophaga sedimenti TaxID=2033606 RepID=UPI002002CB7A|nr:hypothetical protein [Chitinophaga sedimenti]MCK7556745.1 hypothetical protein [Chitinophaga sedimenti]
MYLLIPGRHQLLTNFQFSYLENILSQGLAAKRDAFGHAIPHTEPVTAIIFAVTSANHSGTRRNPLPFYLRAIAIEAMGNALSVPVFSYGVDDVGNLSNFADYTIKRIRHDSDFQFDLTPENTVVLCSTPYCRCMPILVIPFCPRSWRISAPGNITSLCPGISWRK